MFSISRAMMWHFCRQTMWFLPLSFLNTILLPALLFAGLFAMLPSDSRNGQFFQLEPMILAHMLFVMAGAFVSAIMITLLQGSMARLFTAPISTAHLVAWFTFPASFCVAVETGFAIFFLNVLFDAPFPVVGPALWSAALTAAVVLLVQQRSEISISFIALTFLLCVAQLLWLESRYAAQHAFGIPTQYWKVLTVTEVVTLFGFLIFSYLFSVWGISQQRCGQASHAEWIKSMRNRFKAMIDFLFHRSATSFRSPFQAQYWFERHAKVFALPVVTFVMAGVLALISLAEEQRHFWEEFASLGAPLALFGAMIGGWIGSFEESGNKRLAAATFRQLLAGHTFNTMGNFHSTLPLSPFDLVLAKFRTIIKSLWVSHVIWGVVCLAVFGLLRARPESAMPDMPREAWLWFLPLAILGIWIAMANTATVFLTGRYWLVVAYISAGLMLIFVVSLIEGVTVDPVRGDLFGALFFLLASVAVAGTVVAMVTASRRHLLGGRFLSMTATIGLGLLALAILFAPIKLTLSSYSLITLFVTLVILPWVTAPLAVAWNRHR